MSDKKDGSNEHNSRKKKMDRAIQDFIADNAYCSFDDLVNHLNLPHDENNSDYKLLKHRLALLVDREKVERKKQGKYIVPQNIGYVLARVHRPANDPERIYLKPLSWPKNNYHNQPKALDLGANNLIHPREAKDGDLFVVRVQSSKKNGKHNFRARIIDRAQDELVGFVEKNQEGQYFIKPANRKKNYSLPIEQWALKGADEGDLIRYKITKKTDNKGTPHPVVTETIGKDNDWQSISKIVATEFGLTPEFNQKVNDELAQLKDPNWSTANRTDLRNLELLTIDDVTTQDMDDAMLAEPVLDDQGKQIGWHLVVAIADVAQYIAPDSATDIEARRRGNTNYLPGYRCDMIPSEIATDKASLVPNEDRSCLAMHMWINMEGQLTKHKLQRGIMRSRAKLNHTQVEDAMAGNPDQEIAPYMQHIKNLYEAYKPMAKQAKARQKLPIESKEQKVAFDAQGEFDDIKLIDYKDINRVIEEFMVLANVCAALTLIENGYPGLYRTHRTPRERAMEYHAPTLNSLGYNFDPESNQIRKDMIRILNGAKDKDEQELVHQLITMMQSRAEYETDEGIGHYGLALKHYAHFTSPIRRYADLMVHRFLIDACDLGEDGLSKNYSKDRLNQTAEHISNRENLAKQAEREARSRFCAAWLEREMRDALSDNTAKEYDAIITGVGRDGLIIKLTKNGVEGHIPLEHLPGNANYDVIQEYSALAGREEIGENQFQDMIFQQGATIKVQISRASAALNSIKFEPCRPVSAVIPKYQNGILSALHHREADGNQKTRKRRNSSEQAREKRRKRRKGNQPD